MGCGQQLMLPGSRTQRQQAGSVRVVTGVVVVVSSSRGSRKRGLSNVLLFSILW